MNEEWRPIVGFEGVYSVSSFGRIRRDKAAFGATVGRILRPNTTSASGRLYPCIVLRNGGKSHRRPVHIFVAKAFLGPPMPGHECHHRDHNKMNPALDNLEYVTRQTNKKRDVEDGFFSFRYGSETSNAKLTEDQVKAIRASSETCQKLAQVYGVCNSTISRVRNRNATRPTWPHI